MGEACQARNRADDPIADDTLAVIRREARPIPEIVQEVRQDRTGLSGADVKAAVWRLHARGQIEVTPDWKVRRRE
jgi:hypothetical protein